MSGTVFIDGGYPAGLPQAPSVSPSDLVILAQGGVPGVAGTATDRTATLAQIFGGTSLGPFLQISGGTMLGPLTLAADPTQPLQAATKQYVDTTKVTVADSPPPLSQGYLWFNSTTAQLYIGYNDGSSSQWVLANNVDIDLGGGGGGAAAGVNTFNGRDGDVLLSAADINGVLGGGTLTGGLTVLGPIQSTLNIVNAASGSPAQTVFYVGGVQLATFQCNPDGSLSYDQWASGGAYLGRNLQIGQGGPVTITANNKSDPLYVYVQGGFNNRLQLNVLGAKQWSVGPYADGHFAITNETDGQQSLTIAPTGAAAVAGALTVGGAFTAQGGTVNGPLVLNSTLTATGGLATLGSLTTQSGTTLAASGSTATVVVGGAATTFASLQINAISGTRFLGFQTGNSQRWRFTVAGTESTGNAGSDFQIFPYSDTGVSLGAALSIVRSTGLVTVKADPTALLGVATKNYVDTAVAAGGGGGTITTGAGLGTVAGATVSRAATTLTATATAAIPAPPSGTTTCVVAMGSVNTALDIGNGVYEAQPFIVRIDQGATPHTVTLGTSIVLGADIVGFTASGASKSDLLSFFWNVGKAKWMLVAVQHGY